MEWREDLDWARPSCDDYPIPANGMSLDTILIKLQNASSEIARASFGFNEDDLCCKKLVQVDLYLRETIDEIEEIHELEKMSAEA